MHVDQTHGFRLGEWLVKPQANKLIGTDGEVHLEPKVMDTLVQLAQAGGEVVSRKSLLDHVWKRVVINEETLTRTVSELRAALGDSGGERRYITTVPKRGYALVERVHSVGLVDGALPILEEPSPAIAVLPFVSLGESADHEYFADGLTEELICALSQIRGMRVAASRSVFTFKGTTATIQEIGESLGVTHLLEGSIRYGGNRIRITTHFVRVADGYDEWSESFDSELADVFAVQEEIAQAVITALKFKLGLAEDATIVSAPTQNLDAYQCFLRARLRYQNEQTGMTYLGYDDALEAVRLAPDCYDAHGLAAIILTLNTVSEPYHQNEATIRSHIDAALRGNPFQGEALMAKAINIRWNTWDWAVVRAQFDRALAAAPNCPHVMAQFAIRFFRDLGQFEIAAGLLEQAVKIDPINAGPRTSLGYNLRYQGKIDEALEQFDRALAISKDHGYALLGKMLALLSGGRFEEASILLASIESLLGREDLLSLNARGRFLACSGDCSGAQQLQRKIIKLSQAAGGDKHLALPGWMQALQGNIEEAIYWLNLAREKEISQVLTSRAFFDILPGGSVLHREDVQIFLKTMSLDDESLAALDRRGLLAPP
ncbi:MAG: tetratricopeptide repeat protein [Gammaproteobacteria bacterium]|nr:tetratricopeptide repeat protein [Gammaproteobacteria bacterium]MBT7370434.1 tetratricopeptide repeat protein [Gammaproteobacteria bacterium]